MKESAKFVKSEPDFNYFSSDLPCKKHPSNSSSVGICAYCLNEKLMKLVCSDCGEQRLSSCCCSDVSSSYRNSSCTVDVGSVGRISFLMENEKGGGNGDDHQKTLFPHMNQIKKSETRDVVLLKRSNSCVVEVKKSNGFWRIGKLFKKKREKEGCSERNRGGFDQKDEVWVSDCVMDVSRSRSLSSFIDCNFDHEVGSMAYSSAKVSDFNESEPAKSGFRGGLMDFEGGFPAKETDFNRMDDDDSEFIDLKLELSDKSATEHSVIKTPDFIGSSSCRITVNEKGIKKVKNSHMKALKWIFNHHPGKKDLNHIIES